MHSPRASLVAQKVKNLPATQETQIQSLGWEDALEKGLATHSIILAWRIPWTEEPSGLQSMGSQELDMAEQLSIAQLLLSQSCPTLCNPMGCSLPGSSVHGILQARIMELVAMPSSRGSSQPGFQTCVSYISCNGGGFSKSRI